jgi:hypothetical protein
MRPLRRKRPGRAVGLILIFLVCSITTSTFWFGSTWLLIAMALRGAPRSARAPATSRGDPRPAVALTVSPR